MCCIAQSGPNSSAKRLMLLAAASRIEYTYIGKSQYDTFTLNKIFLKKNRKALIPPLQNNNNNNKSIASFLTKWVYKIFLQPT